MIFGFPPVLDFRSLLAKALFYWVFHDLGAFLWSRFSGDFPPFFFGRWYHSRRALTEITLFMSVIATFKSLFWPQLMEHHSCPGCELDLPEAGGVVSSAIARYAPAGDPCYSWPPVFRVFRHFWACHEPCWAYFKSLFWACDDPIVGGQLTTRN
jgi:hypothetical protein